MTEKLIAAVKCPCGAITAAEDGATSVTCAACGIAHRWERPLAIGDTLTITYTITEWHDPGRPMRPGWSVDLSLTYISNDVHMVGSVRKIGADVYLTAYPDGSWTVEVSDSGMSSSEVVFMGDAADEPAAQLAAESACREFARGLLEDLGEVSA